MKTGIRLYLLLLFLSPLLLQGQTRISGRVTDSKDSPLPGANIYIKDTYDGVTSKPDGSFSFKSAEKGDALLIISFVGYKTFQTNIKLTGKEIKITAKLEEEVTQMNAVVVSAGSFEASDEKKGVILRPLDVLTTGAQADLYSTLATLPGTQKIGEESGLFVRGGAASEAKTIIDEMVVQKPFFSSVPDLAARGRFSPMLFKGTVFSTGGYSAQYGQALSSVLILNSQDLAPQTLSAVNLMVFGLGGSHVQRWDNSSLSIEAGYYNLNPYNNVFKSRVDWDKSPVSIEGQANYRIKTSGTGMLKAFVSYTSSTLSLYMPNLDKLPLKDHYDLKSYDFYSNATYRDVLANDLTLFAGASFSFDRDRYKISADTMKQDETMLESKVSLSKKISANSFFTVGAEIQNIIYDNSYDLLSSSLNEIYTAGFAETDLFFTNDIAAKVGIRGEYSKLLNRYNVAPRISFAYKLGAFDQINLAYGRFYETPQKDYLVLSRNFNYENADHYILNYQYVGEQRTFRAEIYYKDYHNLAKGTVFTYPYFNLPGISLSNDGKGYARGIDIFWRDSRTFEYTDYWVSYSYLDTKREYSNYPTMAAPPFTSPHTLSLVVKRWFESIGSYVSLTYTHASGRPYFNPNNPEFLGDRAPAYNNLSGNISVVTKLFDNFTVFFFSIDNLLGFDNVYGYRYSTDGKISSPVLPSLVRSAFLGIFISIGQVSQFQ